jgi:hypothetical protein
VFKKFVASYMGQNVSSTELLNEYMVAFQNTILLINDKLPKVLNAIEEQIKYFFIFDGMDEATARQKFVFLDRQKPIPFTSNVYINAEDSHPANNAQQPRPPPGQKYRDLIEWGRQMLLIFLNMQTNINHYSGSIKNLYSFANQSTYPTIKAILRDYSDYIWRCYEFATSSNADMFLKPPNRRLQKWEKIQRNILTMLDQNLGVIAKFKPSPDVFRGDLPPVADVVSAQQNNFEKGAAAPLQSNNPIPSAPPQSTLFQQSFTKHSYPTPSAPPQSTLLHQNYNKYPIPVKYTYQPAVSEGSALTDSSAELSREINLLTQNTRTNRI